MKEKRIIDLRSDTLTKQSKLIKDAMYNAQSGDYAYGEDISVNELVEYCKELFQVEDALFVTGGMFANRLAIGCQTSPGDEVITHYNYHINFFDSAGNAKVNNIVFNCINNTSGILTISDVKQSINSKPRYKIFAQVKLVTIENSINGFNGKIFPIEEQANLYNFVKSHGISMHLDGARIFNTHVETKIPLPEYAKYTDTMSFCFAKGLGAPFGSMLLGKKQVIEKARTMQVWLGSGYHQIGYYANAAKYALEHNILKLKRDNRMARSLADKIKIFPGIKLISPYPETNILAFSIKNLGIGNNIFLDICQQYGLLLFPWLEGHIRAVIHSSITQNDIDKAAQIIEEVVQKFINKK